MVKIQQLDDLKQCRTCGNTESLFVIDGASKMFQLFIKLLKITPKSSQETICLKCINTVKDFNTLKIRNQEVVEDDEGIAAFELTVGEDYVHSVYEDKSLLNHLTEDCSDEYYRCVNCNSQFNTRIGLTSHHKYYKDKCKEKTYQKYAHLYDKNLVTGKFLCGICKKTYVSKTNMVEHIQTHINPDIFKCTRCNAVFALKKALSYHKKAYNDTCKPYNADMDGLTYDPTSGRFSCDYCDKTYCYKDHALGHVVQHTNPEKRQCKDCNKCFDTDNKLLKHLEKGCDERNLLKDPLTGKYMCKFCPKMYKGKQNLKKHNAIQHNIPKEFECSDCKKKFNTSKALKKHRKTCMQSQDLQATEATEEVPVEEIVQDPPAKKYPCTLCNETFSKKRHLREHNIQHTLERQCQTCNIIFETKKDLKRHKKKNSCTTEEVKVTKNPSPVPETLELVYTCKRCHKNFNSKSHLKQHKKGDTKCNKAYVNES